MLTDFSGSGKTTLLDHLMQQTSLSRTLALINEFGEIRLNHDHHHHNDFYRHDAQFRAFCLGVDEPVRSGTLDH